MNELLERLKMQGSFVIPENQQNKLRNILGLAQDADPPTVIPAEVVEHYMLLKRAMDRLSAWNSGVEDQMLCLAVALAGMQSSKGIELPQVVEPSEIEVAVAEGRVQPGQMVVARWRNQDVPAYVLAVRDVFMDLQINGIERQLPITKVRLVREGEFGDVPKNLNDPVGV